MTVTQGDDTLGEIILMTFPDVSPKHAKNFDSLVAAGAYDGTAFHRVIPGFMIQGGDPNSKNKPRDTWGYGDPGQTRVPAEFNDIHHERGILSAARSADPNSATSQFFLMVADAPHLDNQYTVYGQVLEGMDTIDKIVSAPRDARDNPNEKIEMKIEKIEE
ncbi:MAG: peptidylprolyl isomerase [Candidatus Kapaibacterium sp.]